MDQLASISAFVRTVESGSFTAAAKALGISPQMIAKHIRSLEIRFGSRLLNRTTRRQSLTEFGEDFFAHCCRILEGIDAMETMADEIHHTFSCSSINEAPSMIPALGGMPNSACFLEQGFLSSP